MNNLERDNEIARLQERIKRLETLVRLYDAVLDKVQIPVRMVWQVRDLLDQKKELLGDS